MTQCDMYVKWPSDHTINHDITEILLKVALNSTSPCK